MQSWELAEIEAIKALKARRVRALDMKDWDTYEGLHAPEHVSHGFKGGPAVGPQAMMERLLSQVRDVVTIHMVHSPDIRLSSETTATGSWMLEDRLFWRQGEDEHWFHGFGYYDETYVKRAGRWFFTSRHLHRLRVEVSPGGVSPIR
jgi:hypothetical protein